MFKSLRMILLPFFLFFGLMFNSPFVFAATSTPVDCTNPSNQFQCIDFRQYYPTTASWHNHRFYSGWLLSTYGYLPGPTINASGTPSYTSNFQSLYSNFFNLNKPGQVYTWFRAYNTFNPKDNSGESLCIKTYSNDYLGNDLSVTELGDYLSLGTSCTPSAILGYHNPGTNNATGLSWASPGGLRTELADFPDNAPLPAETFNLQVLTASGGSAYSNWGGNTVWNRIKVVEILPSYTPPYGSSATNPPPSVAAPYTGTAASYPLGVLPTNSQWNAAGPGFGKTYKNVVHIIFYHGVNASYAGQEVTCYQNLDSNWSYSKYYYHLPGYNSYASEYYLAPGVGIIQETDLLYNEDNPAFGSSTCTGMILFTQNQLSGISPNSAAEQALWTSVQGTSTAYIDDP